MFRRRFLMAAFVAAIAALAGPATSRADFKLKIESGSTTVLVQDQDFGPTVPNTNPDQNSAAGTVAFSGPVAGFNVTSSSATSSPPLGTPISAEMDLNTFTIASTGAGTIKFTMSATNFDIGQVRVLESIFSGSTSTGSQAQFQVWVNSDNTLFSTAGDLSSDSGLVGPGGFAITNGDLGNFTGPFSITATITFTATGAGQSISGDGRVNVLTPAPAGLILAASGLPFLGLLRRRLRRSEPATAA